MWLFYLYDSAVSCHIVLIFTLSLTYHSLKRALADYCDAKVWNKQGIENK